jgi:O-antigen/teichoic acid export membrane protein
MKSKLLEIFKSISNYGVAIIFMRLMPFLTIPLILKNLSIEEYGKLGAVQGIIITMVSLTTLNVASSNFRFLRFTDNNFSKFYNRLLINSSNLIVSISILLIGALALFFLPQEYRISGFILILTQSIYSYCISLIRAQNKSKIYSLIEIGKNSIYFIILFVMVEHKLLAVVSILFAFSFCNFLFAIIILMILRKQKWVNIVYSKSLIKRTLIYSLPTLSAYVIQSFLQQSPLIMIHASDEELGIINYANKISLIIFALQSIVFLAWPYFAFKYQEERLHQIVFKSLSILLVLLSWGIYFSFDSITLFISNESFLSAKHISIGFISVYIISILGNMIDTSANIANKTYLISAIFFIGLIVGLLSYSLLPKELLKPHPFLPLLFTFASMILFRLIIYTGKNLFKSWDNYFLSFTIINISILLLIS